MKRIDGVDNIGLHRDHYTGQASETQAALWYLKQGHQVYQPMVQQSWIDFIVEKEGTLLKVQVKTATLNRSAGTYDYLQCRISATHKYSNAISDMYDILFIVYGDEMWEIPSAELDVTNITLSNTNVNTTREYKYDDYKISDN